MAKDIKSLHFIGLVAIFIVTMLQQQILCTDLSDSQRLLNDKLFNYTKVFRPLYNQSNAIDIYLAFDLVSIQDFNEREERLTVTGVLLCSWKDEVFTWNPRDYGGVNYLVIDVGSIWIPRMTLVNPAEEIKRLDEDWHQLYILHTGWVYYNAGGIFSVSCPVDVTYYPWDKQFCELWFMAWGYSRVEINLVHRWQYVKQPFFSENGAWTLVGSQTGNVTEASVAKFGFHLERKPRFVLINVLSPMIFMSFMSTLIFLIPSDSGERISFSITVLLAIAVFLTLVGDNLPKTSNPMSVLSYYLLSVLVVSVCITLVNILSLRLFYKDDKEHVGSFWRRFTTVVQCKCRTTDQSSRNRKQQRLYPRKEPGRSMYPRQSNGCEGRELSYVTTIKVDQNTYESSRQDASSEGNEKANDVDISWKDVSHAFDKTAFLVFSLTLIALTVIFFLFASGMLTAYT